MAGPPLKPPADDSINCDLYSYNYSLCSLMTRYMLVVRGVPAPTFPALKIENTEIDIHHAFDQLDEWYLRDISPQGQVPALRLPTTTITDSLAIAFFILERHPSLQGPAGQEAKHAELLSELHQLDYFAICFTATGAPVSVNPRLQAVEKTRERLGRDGVSEEYKAVLGRKLDVLTTQLSTATPVALAMEAAHTFFAHVEELLVQNAEQGPWIWGQHGPTTLDTHVVALLARLEDVKHTQFFTGRMKEFYEGAVGTETWRGVMGGRSTMG